MDLHLTDEQVELLIAELDRIIEPTAIFSLPRVQALRQIRAMLKPYPVRAAAAPPQKIYEPPSKGRYRRRGG